MGHEDMKKTENSITKQNEYFDDFGVVLSHNSVHSNSR